MENRKKIKEEEVSLLSNEVREPQELLKEEPKQGFHEVVEPYTLSEWQLAYQISYEE